MIESGDVPEMIHVGLSTPCLDPPGARRVEPHKRLMVAVLQTVVHDCRRTAHRRTAGYEVRADLHKVRRAIAYVACTDRTWPFSYENVCEALGLDAGSLRQQLRKEARSLMRPLSPTQATTRVWAHLRIARGLRRGEQNTIAKAH
jgi:hypothetical protein